MSQREPSPLVKRATNDKIWDFTLKTIPKVILAKEKDFDKEWNNYLNGLVKLGVTKVEDYYTKRIKDNLTLWSK